MKRFIAIIITIAMLIVSGCSNEKKYSVLYENDEEAIKMMEDAIATLDKCIEGDTSIYSVCDELLEIANRETSSGNEYASSNINLVEVLIDSRIVIYESGYTGATYDDVIDKIKDCRDMLYDFLYE